MTKQCHHHFLVNQEKAEKDFIVSIVNEFISFLTENEINPIKLFDKYIYDYEDDIYDTTIKR